MTEKGRPTDHANVDLAQLHMQVIRQQAGGQIIWQPRIGCWYTDKQFAGEALPAPYEGMELDDIFRSLGASDRLYQFNACYRYTEDPRVVVRQNKRSETDTETVWETPVGAQKSVERRHPENSHPERLKWPVSSPEELKVATWRLHHTAAEWDEAAYRRLLERYGDLGAPTMFTPRTSVQSLYLDSMGIEAGVMALFEMPDLVEDHFRALAEMHDRLIDVINASPIDIIDFGDNLHCATLSPSLFQRYVLPDYQRRCERLHAAGKFVCSHWDGDTKTLLPFARETGLDGIEAITPEPQGDVTLEEIKEALGDDLFLLDGIPALFFEDSWPLEQLIACAHKVIELFAPKLVLGISDEIASNGNIERVRTVGRIVDDYNASLAGD